MTKPRRDPIAKERFLEGIRQRWALLLVLAAGGVMFADVQVGDFNPEPYLSFLTMVGSVFLAGMHVDSVMKIRKRPEPPLEHFEDHS